MNPDDQTIMFWNLQLQFLMRSNHELEMFVFGLIDIGETPPKPYLSKNYNKYSEKDKMELATFIALKLSGLN